MTRATRRKAEDVASIERPASGTTETVIWRPIHELRAYERNSRTHTPEQITKIRQSFREFGWMQPILTQEDGTIVAGHARVEAAKLEGWDVAKCMNVTGLNPEQVRAYVIADNRIALDAGWDEAMLALEFEELEAAGFDTTGLGFSADELAALLNPESDSEEDEERVPDPPATPASARGDVWLLGKHRITCGDSTAPEDVGRALNGERPHLMVTDPPYGVLYEADWRNKALPGKAPKAGAKPKEGAGRAIGQVMNDGEADWTAAWKLFPGDVAYVWHAGNMCHVVVESLIACEFEIRAQIIWAKSQFVIGRGHYHPHHEPCWYMVRKGGTGHWNGDRKQSTLWEIDKPKKSETGHSTQKPVECMKRPMENNSRPGDAVYEPFSGSGTSIIAAEILGRRCFAIELNPLYVDVAVMRWEHFTGQDAILEATGETFAQVKAMRLER